MMEGSQLGQAVFEEQLRSATRSAMLTCGLVTGRVRVRLTLVHGVVQVSASPRRRARLGRSAPPGFASIAVEPLEMFGAIPPPEVLTCLRARVLAVAGPPNLRGLLVERMVLTWNP